VPSVGEIADAIASRASLPYALYGHSMGARLSFEVLRELRRSGAPMPVRLFVGAALPPHSPEPLARLAGLPEADFIDQLIDWAGAPPELRHEPELRALTLPVLRADFAWIKAYRYEPEPPLDVPITAFAGRDDAEFPPAAMVGWARHGLGGLRLRTLPGGHMFLHDQAERITGLITEELTGGGDPSVPDDDEVHVWLVRAGAPAVVGRDILRRYGDVTGLHVATSGSGDLVLAAVTRRLPVGVAVERLRPPQGLDDRFFDAGEKADLDAEPAETRLVSALRVQAAKKAVLQATGERYDPGTFGFARRDGAGPWRPAPDGLREWRVTHLPVEGGIGAVAVARDRWRLRYETVSSGGTR
jgi:surfactin synthase thioesterase subunit